MLAMLGSIASQDMKTPPFIKVFTSSQNWVVPPGVKKVTVHVIGAGNYGTGGSVSYGNTDYAYGGRGGHSGTSISKEVDVTPGTSIPIIIGASNGAKSEFGNISSLDAGFSQSRAYYPSYVAYYNSSGNVGRSDGFPGEDGIEINGVYYRGAGGSGGVRAWNERIANPSNGGLGGAGAGGRYDAHGQAAIPNTGSGGGGGGYNYYYDGDSPKYWGGAGSSGIVIIEFKGDEN